MVALALTGFTYTASGDERTETIEEGFVSLFDGKSLAGWQAAIAEKEGETGAFSINEAEKAIHVCANQQADSKQSSDCLVSDKEFSHFILKLEYQWLEKRFAPRTKWDRDAGLLFHVHGDLKKVWPHCIEMQIGESPAEKEHGKGEEGRFHSGDLFVLGPGVLTDTPQAEKFYVAEAEKKSGKHVMASKGREKPHGEWNEMEIQVHGHEKAVFILNGEVVLETFNFVHQNEEGEAVTLAKGRIGLQAEWAELLYRNIRIKELPAE